MIENIPYEVLRQGGEFQVKTLPENMKQIGLGVGVIGGGSSKAAPNDAEIEALPVWLIYFAYMIIGTICTVAVVTSITGLVATVKAIPEGEAKGKLADGTVVWQSADGSNWLLHPDGTTEKIGEPPDTTAGAIIAIITVAVVAYVLITLIIPFFKKKAKLGTSKKGG